MREKDSGNQATANPDFSGVEFPQILQPPNQLDRIPESAGPENTAVQRTNRVDAKNMDALGLSNAGIAEELLFGKGRFSEQMVWDQLKTVYDPEIPVNIVDLGLVYLPLAVPPRE